MKGLRWWHPVATAIVALASGVAPYVALTASARLSPGLRDRPWPFELVAVVATVGTVWLTVRAYRRRSARAVATVAAVLASASTALLLLLVHVITYAIPPAPTGLRVGVPAPEFTLPDETGAKVSLSSMRGRPTLLVFYRGHW